MQLTSTLEKGGVGSLLSGVKNFLPANKLLPVTRLTEALMDPASASTASLQETDDYIFLDPRARSGAGGELKGKRMMFQEGIVFAVGGAGYAEYGNLGEWATKSGRKVAYGGTEILEPTAFLNVLARLGN